MNKPVNLLRKLETSFKLPIVLSHPKFPEEFGPVAEQVAALAERDGPTLLLHGSPGEFTSDLKKSVAEFEKREFEILDDLQPRT